MYVGWVVTPSLASECFAKSHESDLLSEPQYFDYNVFIYIYIFMGHTENIIVQNNFLVKSLLKSFKIFDIWLLLSLQKQLYKAQRIHITLTSETCPSENLPCWHLRSHCLHLPLTHLPCLLGKLWGLEQKCFQKSFQLPAQHISVLRAWMPPQLSLTPIRMPAWCTWPQHNELWSQSWKLVQCLQKGLMHKQVSAGRIDSENSSMLMLFLFKLLISAAQRNVLCWRSLEVWPVLFCILSGRSFWPDVVFWCSSPNTPSQRSSQHLQPYAGGSRGTWCWV